MTQAERDIRRKLRIFKHAEEIGNVSKTCRYFGISRSAYYAWKQRDAQLGKAGLINNKPCPENPKLRVAAEVEEKVLYLSIQRSGAYGYWIGVETEGRSSITYWGTNCALLSGLRWIVIWFIEAIRGRPWNKHRDALCSIRKISLNKRKAKRRSVIWSLGIDR